MVAAAIGPELWDGMQGGEFNRSEAGEVGEFECFGWVMGGGLRSLSGCSSLLLIANAALLSVDGMVVWMGLLTDACAPRSQVAPAALHLDTL